MRQQSTSFSFFIPWLSDVDVEGHSGMGWKGSEWGWEGRDGETDGMRPFSFPPLEGGDRQGKAKQSMAKQKSHKHLKPPPETSLMRSRTSMRAIYLGSCSRSPPQPPAARQIGLKVRVGIFWFL